MSGPLREDKAWFSAGLAILQWHFVDGGRRVAFGAEPVHFGCAVNWALIDIATERTLATFDEPQVCGEVQNPPKVTLPQWVTGNLSGIR